MASKQKINPWDTLEAYKNPAPLSWSFFGAVRMERKPLKYQEQFRLTHYHTHTREKSDDYYFQPPQLPPDEKSPRSQSVATKRKRLPWSRGPANRRAAKGRAAVPAAGRGR